MGSGLGDLGRRDRRSSGRRLRARAGQGVRGLQGRGSRSAVRRRRHRARLRGWWGRVRRRQDRGQARGRTPRGHRGRRGGGRAGEGAGEAERGRPSAGDLLSLGDLFTAGTGLDLPDDLVTLLGNSLSLSVGGDAPADLDSISGPADLPLGLLVHGDDAKIREIIAKVEARTGARLSELPATVASTGGKVAVATNPAYAEDLLANGSLARSRNFKDVVSHVSEAQAVVYVSLDNQWADAFRDLAADEDDKEAKEVADNLAVLRAVGGSAWSDGDTGHGLIRIALK